MIRRKPFVDGRLGGVAEELIPVYPLDSHMSKRRLWRKEHHMLVTDSKQTYCISEYIILREFSLQNYLPLYKLY